MTPDQLADVASDMLIAQLTGKHRTLFQQLSRLLAGPRGDSLGVALALAATVAEDQTLSPGQEFHQLTVSVTEADGTHRPGSAEDLTPPARVFCQMVVALANGDGDMATDLYIGFVGDNTLHAAQVIAIGLVVAARYVTSFGCMCPPGTHQ